MLVRIYEYTTIKSIRPVEGVGLYILATEIGGTEATIQGEILFKENPEKKGEFEKASDKVSHLITALEAVKRLNEKCDALEIYTDSSFLVAGWDAGWLDKWKNNGWKDVHGNDIAHKELWQGIDNKLTEIGAKPLCHLMERHPWTGWFEREGKAVLEKWKNTETSS